MGSEVTFESLLGHFGVGQPESLLSHFWVTLGSFWISVELGARPLHKSIELTVLPGRSKLETLRKDPFKQELQP